MSIFWNERSKRCFAQHATSYSTSEEKKEVGEMLPIILPGAKFQCAELFAVQVSVPYTLPYSSSRNSLLPWLIRNWLILMHFSPSPSNIHREIRGCPCQRKTGVSEHSLVTTWVTISRNSSRDLMLDAVLCDERRMLQDFTAVLFWLSEPSIFDPSMFVVRLSLQLLILKRIVGFQCHAIQNRSKQKSKPFNR